MDEDFVICPFDKSHVISKLRIQYHLVKCKKHYPFSKKIVCPYDATEYIDADKFTAHLCQCKKKRHLDVSEEFRQKQYEFIQRGDVSVQTFFAPGVEVTDEWDISAHHEDDSDTELTADELKFIELRRQTSQALQRARAFSQVLPGPIGRGKGSDLFENYVKNLEHTPENSKFVESVNYFPFSKENPFTDSGNTEVVKNLSEEEIYSDNEGIYDDAEGDEIKDNNCRLAEKTVNLMTDITRDICTNINESNIEREIREKEIYEDADEQENGNNTNKSSDVSMVNSKSCINQNTYEFLKYNKHPLGRGVNKNVTSFGRGSALGKGAYIRNLQRQIVHSSLDLIIQNALNEKSSCVAKPSISKDDSKVLINSGSDKNVEVINGTASSATANNSEKLSNLSSDSLSNFSENQLSYSSDLDDASICFQKQRRNPRRNTLDFLINNIVKDLSSTSLESDTSESERSVKTSDSFKQRTLQSNENVYRVSSFGRGNILKNTFM